MPWLVACEYNHMSSLLTRRDFPGGGGETWNVPIGEQRAETAVFVGKLGGAYIPYYTHPPI